MGRIAVPVVGFLVGLGFVAALFFAIVTTNFEATPETAAEQYHLAPKPMHFSFDNAFVGRYDRQQLQRGFQVYKEVCSACHSMRLVAFRDLQEIGFTAPEVKAIAKQWQVEVPSIDEKTGDSATRKAIPADHFPSPFQNDVAARAANNNALPPDFSLLAKAREHGAHYIASLVTGYATQPAELLKEFPDAKTPPGLHYNPYFANLNIAMPPPLVSDGQVSYADGTKATVNQMGQDVAAFMMWAAEPKLENRHRTGLAVLVFLLSATGLAYGAYRNIWQGKKH